MNEEDSLGGERSWLQDITRYQWMVLLVTTLGWGLDGFDGVLYTLVLGPSVTELLNNPSSSELAFYGGLAASLYLYGWALGAVLFGILADYFGRVRVLSVSILTYALFTGLCAIVTEYWQLAAFRFIAGLGSGVELPVGAALIAETWNNRYRSKATGIMMSGFAVGFFLASVAYWLVGGYGWRVVFLLGLLPALTVFIIRRNVHEPETMAEVRARRAERKAALRAGAAKTTEDRFVLSQLLRPPLLKRTVPAMLICIGGLFSFWAITTWTPEVVRNVMEDRGIIDNAAIPYVASITAALHLGGIVGYASWGFIADRIGQKRTIFISLTIWIVAVVVAYFSTSKQTFYIVAALAGIGMGSCQSVTRSLLALFTPKENAAEFFGFLGIAGKALAFLGPIIFGTVSQQTGSQRPAILSIGIFFVVGMILLSFVDEKRGKEASRTPVRVKA